MGYMWVYSKLGWCFIPLLLLLLARNEGKKGHDFCLCYIEKEKQKTLNNTMGWICVKVSLMLFIPLMPLLLSREEEKRTRFLPLFYMERNETPTQLNGMNVSVFSRLRLLLQTPPGQERGNKTMFDSYICLVLRRLNELFTSMDLRVQVNNRLGWCSIQLLPPLLDQNEGTKQYSILIFVYYSEDLTNYSPVWDHVCR